MKCGFVGHVYRGQFQLMFDATEQGAGPTRPVGFEPIPREVFEAVTFTQEIPADYVVKTTRKKVAHVAGSVSSASR